MEIILLRFGSLQKFLDKQANETILFLYFGFRLKFVHFFMLGQFLTIRSKQMS